MLSTNLPIAANRNGVFPSATLNIANVNEGLVLSISDQKWDYLTIQETYDGAISAGSVVVKILVSNSGSQADAVDFPTGAVTLSAAGMTALQRVTSFGFVHIVVTTAGTSGTYRIWAVASKQINP